MERQNRFVNNLADKLLGVCDNPHLKSEELFPYLQQLAEYFIQRTEPDSHLKLHPVFNLAHPAGDGEIGHAEYLVEIVRALSCVVSGGSELYSFGMQLVDKTGKVYRQGADSYTFTRKFIPAMVLHGLAMNGDDLVRGAEVAINSRGSERGESFFPRLVDSITTGKVVSLNQLAAYR